MERLGIEPISVFGMPPVPYIELAADLGLRYIAIMLTAMPNSYGYPPFSLRDDRELRRHTLAALHDREVSIALGEGMVVREDTDMRDLAIDIAVMGELGAQRVNTMSFDPIETGPSTDSAPSRSSPPRPGWRRPSSSVRRSRSAERFRRGSRSFERSAAKISGSSSTPCTSSARAPERRTSRHSTRSSSGTSNSPTPPLVPTIPDYMEEACFERMVPGTGELPLVDILAALPSEVVIGLEVPLRSQADLGIGPHERLGRCVEAARDLLALSEHARP